MSIVHSPKQVVIYVKKKFKQQINKMENLSTLKSYPCINLLSNKFHRQIIPLKLKSSLLLLVRIRGNVIYKSLKMKEKRK